MMNLFVITGGPGVGKTTLIQALKRRGYTTVAEDARAIIKAETNAGGDALPWKNKQKYALAMLHAGVKRYREISAEHDKQPVFFDRSVIDSLCYVEMERLKIDPTLVQLAQACVYHCIVFILPPWKAIYETDAERKQSWQEAQETYDSIAGTYSALGYQLVVVPRESVTLRCDFVINFVTSLVKIV